MWEKRKFGTFCRCCGKFRNRFRNPPKGNFNAVRQKIYLTGDDFSDGDYDESRSLMSSLFVALANILRYEWPNIYLQTQAHDCFWFTDYCTSNKGVEGHSLQRPTFRTTTATLGKSCGLQRTAAEYCWIYLYRSKGGETRD